MISKKIFVECIEAIKKQNEIEHKVCDGLDLVLDGSFVPQFSETLSISFLKLLRDVMSDDDDWIGWFMWEKDFGLDKKMTANYKNGKQIKLDSAEDLYKFLVKNSKK